jgi:hypothetical protein
MAAPPGNYLLSPFDSDVTEHIKLFIKFKAKTSPSIPQDALEKMFFSLCIIRLSN